MLKPFPKNKFSDLTPAELRKARADRLVSRIKIYDMQKREGQYSVLQPTLDRIETELQQINAELTKDK